MPIDVTTPDTPGWWLARLLKQLESKQAGVRKLDRYYRGDCDLPDVTPTVMEAYRTFQRKARMNWSELVVEAVRERMSPTGFRTGGDGDDLGDKEAWRIWQANGLDADSALVHRSMLSMGDAYVIVGAPDGDDDVPLITPEDPRQVITAQDAVYRRKTVAALKVFGDDIADADRAYLYLPGQVWQATKTKAGGGQYPWSADGWTWRGDPETLPIDDVPVVRFGNRMDLYGRSMGEFEDVIDVIDRINHMVLQRIVIATVQAFRQRAVKGDLPQFDPQGNPVDYAGIFRADPGALWQLPEGAEMWESQATDLTPILTAVRHDVQDLAAMTRTPLFYLTPDAANGSAEGASLAREGLVFKVRDRLAQTGEAWEQVLALAFAMTGDEKRAQQPDMEVLWASPERFSLTERYTAAVQAQAAGVPWRTVMTDILQFTPQQVERMETERTDDALVTAISQPAPSAPTSPLPPVAPAPVA